MQMPLLQGCGFRHETKGICGIMSIEELDRYHIIVYKILAIKSLLILFEYTVFFSFFLKG